MLRRCLNALLLLFPSILVIAQLPDYHVQLFDETFGLRTDLQRVVKDHRDFVWLVSIDHVHRFDGRTVTDYPFDNRLYNLICDNTGSIWVTTRQQVFRYVNEHSGFCEVSVNASQPVDIGRIFQVPGHPVQILTQDGFYTWEDSVSTFIENTSAELLLTGLSLSNFSSSAETIFVTARDSLFAIDVGEHTRRGMPCDFLSGIFAVSENLVLATLRGNTSVWYDLETYQVTAIDPKTDILHRGSDFLHVLDILPLSNSEHLVASHKGLLMLNSATRTFKQLTLHAHGKPLDPTPYFIDLFMDRHQDVWLTHGSGLIRFQPLREQIGLLRNREADEAKSWYNIARNFTEDEHGNIWITTAQGFGCWDLRTNQLTMYNATEGVEDRLNQPSLRGIAYDGTHLIMGTAAAGVWLYNPHTRAYRRPIYLNNEEGTVTRRMLESDFIRQLIRLPNGNYLISGNSLYIMDAKNYQVNRSSLAMIRSRNSSMCYVDSRKQLWLSAENRLYRIDSTLTRCDTFQTPITVDALCEYNDSVFYAGTIKGLFTLFPAGAPFVMQQDTQIRNTVRIAFVTADQRKKLWIGSDEGLYRYDPIAKNVELFDFADNIQGNIFSPNATYLNKEGMLILGGINGINYFHPALIPQRKDSLKLTLMRLLVNADDTSYLHISEPFVLNHTQNAIEVEYVAPWYGNTNRLQYRYRLAGYSDAWQDNGSDGLVRFTSLPPGRYTFQIAASVNDRDWYEGSQPLQFTILPPFWKRWWFITLAVIALGACVLYIVRRRIQLIKQQETEKRKIEIDRLTMNRDLATSQLTALRAQMNPHFIFNALNSVQRYILKGDVDQANKYLSKFSRLQREVLNNSSQDFISLEHEIEILELYLQLEQSRFNENFSYSITTDPEIDADEVMIPPMILQPFIENAIWHGLMPHTGKKILDISFTLQDDILLCRILDNGIGRSASLRLKENQNSNGEHKSRGMSLVHERLHTLEQLYQRSFNVEILDRIDASGTVEGTEVNLRMHVGR